MEKIIKMQVNLKETTIEEIDDIIERNPRFMNRSDFCRQAIISAIDSWLYEPAIRSMHRRYNSQSQHSSDSAQ